jgi:hypothetical protein
MAPLSRIAPYLSLRKSQTKEARILPLKGMLGLRRSREMTTPQIPLKTCHKLDIGFVSCESATNKALQEVRFLGGFGLWWPLPCLSTTGLEIGATNWLAVGPNERHFAAQTKKV